MAVSGWISTWGSGWALRRCGRFRNSELKKNALRPPVVRTRGYRPVSSGVERGLSGGNSYGAAFVVEDTGAGIPADRKDVVFQPFQTTKKGGTGLGLAIVDKTVQAHGGRIALVSEPGKGSRFIMYLPV